ncbi:MAG: tetratricopeptide repeat protein [Candidatus Thiothrix singaporensis]|uniref:Tetratricopeptide repeat protein n=1 Tax=Candidatus Thiothrix singaporensis TaxID=2799669 RepID=A0A7L6AZ43_9GAMM|nr:MAG: tetratricopeptide repeat protein [Candidatus Thiothrix singaporensis]
MATTLTYLGQLYQSEGKYQEAEQCYQQSIEKSPDKARAALPLASLYEAQAHYDKAEPLLTAALAEMTQPPAQDSTQTEQQLDATVLAGILDMQGRVNTALGNYSAARTSFQQNLANNLLPPAPAAKPTAGRAGQG